MSSVWSETADADYLRMRQRTFGFFLSLQHWDGSGAGVWSCSGGERIAVVCVLGLSGDLVPGGVH